MGKKLVIALVMTMCAILATVPSVQAYATSIDLLRVTWNHDNITVYISLQKGVDPSYADQVQTAFKDWSSALKSWNPSAFNFVFVSQPVSKKYSADIVVTVKKNTGNVLGSTSWTSSGGIIQIVKITLNAYNAMGIPLGKEDFRNIARHEIGHAIGLGHSNDNGVDPLDLMAPTLDFTQVNYDIYPSPLDLNAVIYIYGNDGFGGTNLSSIPPSYP